MHDNTALTLRPDAYVYVITNTINGHKYVGQTRRSTTIRWNEHLAYARQGRDSRLYRAIRKYGEYCFQLETVAVSNLENIDLLERLTILLLGTHNKEVGYNNSMSGGARWPSIETKEKLSRILKGKTPWNRGRKVTSLVTIARLRAARLRRGPISARGLESIRQSKLGVNNPNFGKIMSAASRAKMSAAKRGRTAWNKGISTPENVKQKMRGERPCIQGENNYLFRKDVSTASILQLRSIGFTFKQIAKTLKCGTGVVQSRLEKNPIA